MASVQACAAIMKKVTTISLALLLGLAAGGCSTSSDNEGASGTASPGSSASPSKETPPAKPAEKVSLSMLVPSQSNWTYSKDKPIWKAIEEKTGYSIEGQVPPGNDYDGAVNLTIASGNMPDLIFMSSFTKANKYGQQGALVNILDYLDQAPNLKKWLGAHPDILQRFSSVDGKLYEFPNDQNFGLGDRIIWMYRDDVFKKNGLNVPQTYDELYDVLKKLKQLYPDSYPFSTRAGLDTLSRMAPQFNTFNDTYYDFDRKEWRYGPIEDNYKKLIAFMNKLYKEGLLAPDWLTFNSKKWEDSLSNDKAFVFLDYVVMDYYNVPLRKDRPDFTMLFMPPPAGFEGASRVNINKTALDIGMSIASTSKKIKEAMKYMDFFYSDEGEQLSTWGVEGVTYEMADGKKQYLKSFKTLSELREKPGLFNFGTYTRMDFSATLTFMGMESQDAFKQAANYDSKLQPRPPFTDQQIDVLNTVGEAVKKYQQENATKFILGNRSLDEWDQYVGEVKKLGLDQLVKTYKDAYDHVQNRK